MSAHKGDTGGRVGLRRLLAPHTCRGLGGVANSPVIPLTMQAGPGAQKPLPNCWGCLVTDGAARPACGRPQNPTLLPPASRGLWGPAVHTRQVDMSQGFLECPGTGLWGLPWDRLGGHWGLEGPPHGLHSATQPPTGKGGAGPSPWQKPYSLVSRPEHNYSSSRSLFLPSAYFFPRDPAASAGWLRHHLPRAQPVMCSTANPPQSERRPGQHRACQASAQSSLLGCPGGKGGWGGELME